MQELYVSTRGSDGNPGTSNAPLRNIKTAAAKAKPGMTILIEGGTYYEQVRTQVAGAAGKEITFKSHNGTAVLDGSKLTWGESHNASIFELYHPYNRIEGLKITNSANSGVTLVADNLTVQGCEITNIENHGITNHLGHNDNPAQFPLIRNITIKDNVVHNVVTSSDNVGQAISMAADGFVVSGNKVYDSKDIGIDIWMGAKHGEVVDNTVYNNKLAVGIYIDGATYVRVHRNRVYANRTGITVSSEDTKYATENIWVYNNLIYDHTTNEGISMWEPDSSGPKNVVFVNNTLANNRIGFGFYGSNMQAKVLNNLAHSTSNSFYNEASSSTISNQSNVWLSSLTGFVAPASKDFRLTSASTAINKGATTPSFNDDLGNTFSVTTDFAGLKRIVDSKPDAGAYEYQ